MDIDIIFNIALLMILMGGVTLFIIKFIKLGKEKQLEMISEWLLLAVVQAEKELGEKTGKIKLRYVYDMFIQRFGKLSMFITFEQFSSMVDVALDKMKDILSNNEELAKYIGCVCQKDKCECEK